MGLAAVLIRGVCGLALLGAVGLFALPSPALAKEYKSLYVTVQYTSAAQLTMFAQKVAPGPIARKLTEVLASSPNPTSGALGQYLDALLKRVQMLLDMRLSRMTIKIRILDSEEQVMAEFLKLTGGHLSRYHSRRPPAFFSRKDNTIYIQTRRLNVGMLAHEMAHAVLLHYFRVPPPLKIQEMLAIYIDREISRQAR